MNLLACPLHSSSITRPAFFIIWKMGLSIGKVTNEASRKGAVNCEKFLPLLYKNLTCILEYFWLNPLYYIFILLVLNALNINISYKAYFKNARCNSALCDVYSKKSYLDCLTINLQNSTIFLNITGFDFFWFLYISITKNKIRL